MSDVSDIEMGRSGLQLAAEYIIQQDPTIKLKVLKQNGHSGQCTISHIRSKRTLAILEISIVYMMEEILFLALCRLMLPRTLAIGRQQTQARGEILIKGKGLLKTYWIIGTEHVSLPGESQQKTCFSTTPSGAKLGSHAIGALDYNLIMLAR